MKISRNDVNQQNNSSFLPSLINCQAPICLFWHIFLFFENFGKYTLQIEVSFLFCKLFLINSEYTISLYIIRYHFCTSLQNSFCVFIDRCPCPLTYYQKSNKVSILPWWKLNLRWINENPIKIYLIQTSPGKRRAFVSLLLTGL